MKGSMVKHIIFDFDGVLAQSNAVRIEGFRTLFKDYPAEQRRRLIEYAKKNGGISRYEKIRYFFENIRGEAIDDAEISLFAGRYSKLVERDVIKAKPVMGSLKFLAANYQNYDFAIVSGSDQEELRGVCRQRKIDHYFVEILGSPTSKERNLAGLMSKLKWRKADCLFIGDSANDLTAAQANGIHFIGLKSDLKGLGPTDKVTIIEDFSELHSHLV
jgi:phosphoglycolate phosphatase-like HAD superfamily hydrolase